MLVVDIEKNQINRDNEVLIQFEPGTSSQEIALYVRALRKIDEVEVEPCCILLHPKRADLVGECFSVGVNCF
jgi:hypothetical protein